MIDCTDSILSVKINNLKVHLNIGYETLVKDVKAVNIPNCKIDKYDGELSIVLEDNGIKNIYIETSNKEVIGLYDLFCTMSILGERFLEYSNMSVIRIRRPNGIETMFLNSKLNKK